jgi:hypothetical protein
VVADIDVPGCMLEENLVVLDPILHRPYSPWGDLLRFQLLVLKCVWQAPYAHRQMPFPYTLVDFPWPQMDVLEYGRDLRASTRFFKKTPRLFGKSVAKTPMPF